MKVIVCIKQVPDTKGGVQFNPDGTLNRAAMLTIMNPDDKAGLEAALRLKDQYGAEVTVLTMGLPKAADVLQEAIAMGADKGVLVTDRVLGGADTWATSTTIAGALRKLDYDLIITGRQAIDGDTAQVGPAIAEHLTIPHAAWVAEIMDVNEKSIQIRQDLVSVSQVSEIPYPCLLTIDKDTCVPRLPSYLLKKATADRPVRILSFEDMPDQDLSRYGLIGSPTSVEKMFAPEEGEKQVYLEGTAKEKADKLVAILTGKKII